MLLVIVLFVLELSICHVQKEEEQEKIDLLPLVGQFRSPFEELFSHNLMPDPNNKTYGNVYKIILTLIFSLTPFPVTFYEKGYFCSSSNKVELLFFLSPSKNLNVLVEYDFVYLLLKSEESKFVQYLEIRNMTIDNLLNYASYDLGYTITEIILFSVGVLN